MTNKGVIFDLDGTLVDSIKDIAEASNHVMEILGYRNFTVEEYMTMCGGGNKILFERLLKVATGSDPPAELVAKAVALKREYENGENGHKFTIPFSGIHNMLQDLQQAGVQVAVLSNKVEALVQSVVKDIFPNIDWKHVAGQRDDTPPKPDPTAANRILKEFMINLKATDCFFVGDTSVDMKTAKAAGMTAIGVDWGFRSAEELESTGAAIVVSKANDITNFVLQNN